MDAKSFMALLDVEIAWCQQNPTAEITVDFMNGFIAGLQQAKFIIRNFDKQAHETLDMNVLCLYSPQGGEE